MKLNHIIIVSTALLVALVVLLAYTLHRTGEEEVLIEFNEYQILIARQVATQIEAYMSDRSRGIQVLSTFASFQHRDKKQMGVDVSAYFERLKTKHVKSISVYEENGTIIYSIPQRGTEIGPSDGTSDWFSWAKSKENKGKVFISSLIRIPEGDQESPPYFRSLLVTPLYEDAEDERYTKPGKQFVGVLTVTVDLQELLGNLIAYVNTGSRLHQAWVIEQSGRLLFSTNHPSFSYVQRMLETWTKS
jgi:hypothetical protein